MQFCCVLSKKDKRPGVRSSVLRKWMCLWSYFKWCGVTAERGVVVEFGEELNAQPVDIAWRWRQGVCFPKVSSEKGWWQKFLSEKDIPFFLIHSYCDFLTEYLNFTSPGEVGTVFSFICFRVTNISALQGGARDKPSWGCAWEGWAWGRAEGPGQCQGVVTAQKQLKGLVCLPVTAWRRS